MTVWDTGRFDFPKLYLHMFQEDIQLRVAPIGGRRFNKSFKAVFDGDAKKYMSVCFELISENSYGGPEEKISDAVRRIVAQLVACGTAHFEILGATLDGEKGYFVLHPIRSDMLYRVPSGYAQRVPKSQEGGTVSRFLFLPKSRVWQISIPRILGGQRGFTRVRNLLGRVDGLPEFNQQELKKGRLETPCDMREFRRMMQMSILNATKHWGWNARDTSLDYETEFYLVVRYARFIWATATLREHIVVTLNSLLRALNISGSFRLEGITTPVEALDVISLMTAGEIDIAEAYTRLNRTD